MLGCVGLQCFGRCISQSVCEDNLFMTELLCFFICSRTKCWLWPHLLSGFINDSTRPKAKKKLFHQASPPSNIPSQRKKNPFQARISEVTLSLNQLSCQLTPDSSHAKDVSHEELDVVVKRSAAVLKQKRNQRGWTKVVARRGEGAWEEEKVELPKGWEARKSGWGKKRAIEKAYKKTSSLLEGFDDDMSPDFMPQRKRNYAKAYNKVSRAASVYHQPNQKLRGKELNNILSIHPPIYPPVHTSIIHASIHVSVYCHTLVCM